MVNLLELPEEILLQVVRLVESDKHEHEPDNALDDYVFPLRDGLYRVTERRKAALKSLFNLTYTCRRLRCLAETLMYRNVFIRLHHRPYQTFDALLRHFYDSPEPLATWTHTRVFTCVAAPQPRRDEQGGRQIFDLRRLFALPNLEILTIAEYNYSKWYYHDTSPHVGLPRLGTSSVTTLRLDKVCAFLGKQELRILLGYPRALKRLSFEVSYTNFSGECEEWEHLWDPNVLVFALQPHLATLEALRLIVNTPFDMMTCDELPPTPRIQLGAFTALKHLRIGLVYIRGANNDRHYKALPSCLETLQIAYATLDEIDLANRGPRWLRRIARKKPTCFPRLRAVCMMYALYPRGYEQWPDNGYEWERKWTADEVADVGAIWRSFAAADIHFAAIRKIIPTFC